MKFALDYDKLIFLDAEELAEGGIREAYTSILPQSLGRAAHALFKIINDQLTNSEYRLFAINGGNDLGGMFLTQSELEDARRSLPRPEDWPYLPTPEHPWYGQPHS